MTRIHYLVLTVVLVLCVLTSIFLLDRGQDWGDDFALYIRQAASITQGTEAGFVAQNLFMNANSSRIFTPPAGPWGFPLILAPFYAFFGLDPLALKVPGILFFVLFLVVFFLLMKGRLRPMEGILIIAILAFTPLLISAQNAIMSDIPFLAISTLSIWLIVHFVCENPEMLGSLFQNIVLGGVIFLAYLIRANGSLLLIMLFVCQLIVAFQRRNDQIDRKRMLLRLAAPPLVFGMLWGISAAVLPGSSQASGRTLGILGQLNSMEIIKNNLYVYFHMIDEAFLGDISGGKIIYGFLLAFFLVGVLARFKEDYPFLIYSGMTMALLVNFPLLGGPRYFFPLFPFFIYFSYQGMKAAFSGFSGNSRRIGLAIANLLWIALFLAYASSSVRMALENMRADRQTSGPFDATSAQMFDFIKAETTPESVIVFAKPRAMLLMTDRNSIMINHCDELMRGDYIVLFRDGDWDQVPADQIASCVLNPQQVFENPGFVVYKIGE
jgi:hypothetical protein